MPVPRSYWRFALPLVLLGPFMSLGQLAQQAALLEVAGGVRELAAFALASAMLNPFANVMGMAPQLGQVLGRDRQGYRVVRRLVHGLGFAMLIAVVAIAAGPLGPAVTRASFQVDHGLAAIVLEYLLWFALAIPVLGIERVAGGQLIRSGRTATVTGVRIGQVVAVVATLVLGHRLGWSIRGTLIASRLVPAVLGTAVLVALARPIAPTRDDPQAPHLGMLAALRFFAPMAFTTVMFTLSRPILYALVGAMAGPGPRSELIIAALSLAFATGFLFQSMINNALRNLFASFADRDPLGCRRFAVQLTVAVTLGSLVFLAGPPARWFIQHALGADGAVLELALDACAVLALSPLAVAWRNWYHGLAMVHRRTGAMVVGSLGRNGWVVLVGGALALGGALSVTAAAAVMVGAFLCEAIGTILGSRRWRAELAALGPDPAPGARPETG